MQVSMSIPSGEASRTASPVSGQPGDKLSYTSEHKVKTQRVTRSVSKRLDNSATPVTPDIVLSQRTITPEKPESMSAVSTATVAREPRKQHSTDNRAPLFKYAPEMAIPSTSKTNWLMRWNDISPIKKQGNKKSKKNLKKQIKSYIQSMADDEREAWLNTRMTARKSDGAIFPALKGQSEVIAGCDLKAFELLGHYAGEIHNGDTLPDLIDSAGLVNVSSYQMSLSNNCTLSAFGCGNVCSLINAPNTTSAPKRKGQANLTVEANVAPIRVLYKGQECALMVTLKPVKCREILWYDYGPKYWHQLQLIKRLESSQAGPDTQPEATGSSLTPEAQAMITGSEVSADESEYLEATCLPSFESKKRRAKQPAQSVKKIRTEAPPSQQSQIPLAALPASPQVLQFVHHQVRITFIRAMCRLFNNANIASAPEEPMRNILYLSQQCFPQYWYSSESSLLEATAKERWMHRNMAQVKNLFDKKFKFTILGTYYARNPIPCCLFLLGRLFPDSLQDIKITDLIARLKAFPACADFTDDQINKFLQSSCINIQERGYGTDRLFTVSLTHLSQQAYRSAYIDYLNERDRIDQNPRVQFLQVCQWISENKTLKACLTTERANEILALLFNFLRDCNIPFNKLTEGQEAETGFSQPPPAKLPSDPSPEHMLVTVSESNIDRIIPKITEKLASYFQQPIMPVAPEVQPYTVLAALLTLMGEELLFTQKANNLKQSAGRKQPRDIRAALRRPSVQNAGLVQTQTRREIWYVVSEQLKAALVNALAEIGYQL